MSSEFPQQVKNFVFSAEKPDGSSEKVEVFIPEVNINFKLPELLQITSNNSVKTENLLCKHIATRVVMNLDSSPETRPFLELSIVLS